MANIYTHSGINWQFFLVEHEGVCVDFRSHKFDSEEYTKKLIDLANEQGNNFRVFEEYPVMCNTLLTVDQIKDKSQIPELKEIEKITGRLPNWEKIGTVCKRPKEEIWPR